MKLTSLQIDDFRQFKNFRIDFTDPATGQPLEKVCFIGPNGTGKSTLLKMIARDVWGQGSNQPDIAGSQRRPELGWVLSNGTMLLRPKIADPFAEKVIELTLTVLCPSDGDGGTPQLFDLPHATLNEALSKKHTPELGHLVTLNEANAFWTRLVYHLKRREQLLIEFQRLTENRRKAIEDIDAEFDAANPHVLDRLADVWNKILNLAHLEFDRESVEIPIQLTDNLKAYIRTKDTKTRVTYSSISTGIRHYLFRLGHIWSLYFNRPPGDSILLVDEPEGSLYPDFLYDIVENYREVAPGCQLFMATHSPIVAAQFKPEERFILNFGEDGYVTARRGTSPEGDDPNDLLRQDFGVASLMTEVGERAWDRFLQLRRLIPKTPEADRKPLIEEYTRLGQAYHFAPPGGSNGDGV